MTCNRRNAQPPIKKYKKAAVYIRTAANNAEAAAEQRKDCMQYIERNGYQFAGEFSDIGTSGLTNSRRGLDALIIDAQLKEIDTIIIASMSRLSRSVKEAIAFCSDLQASCGVTIEAVEGRLKQW